MSPPPECVVEDFTHDSLIVKCVRKKTSSGSSKNKTSSELTINRSDGDHRNKADKVTFTQATRMKSPDEGTRRVYSVHEFDRKWKGTEAEDRRDVEQKIYPQIPYVTLENKEKQPHEIDSSKIKNIQDGSSREKTTDDEQNSIVLPHFVLTARERDTNQLVLNETSK